MEDLFLFLVPQKCVRVYAFCDVLLGVLPRGIQLEYYNLRGSASLYHYGQRELVCSCLHNTGANYSAHQICITAMLVIELMLC